eukprot:m.457829 g.457829  ORF g.457829 m.457829 type:complete len:484 (+) comp21356_c0_seq1:80-1531(+)
MWSDDGVVLSDEKSPLFPGSDNEVRPYHSVAADNKDFKGDGNAPLFQDGENVDASLVTASVFSSFINLTNTVVGAGVLALPFAFKSTGVVLGIIVLFGVYSLIILSIELLVASSKHSQVKSYRGISEAAMGKYGNWLTQGAVFLSTFGAMTSYLIIIGDMMGPLIGFWMGGTNDDYCSIYARRQFPITVSLLIVVPLTMLRNIDSLRYTSGIAVCAVLYLLMVVVFKSGESISENSGMDNMKPHDFFNFSEKIFRAVPIMTLAFTCHMNVMPILTGLKHPTKRRVRQVTWGAITTCQVLYIVIGLFGFLTFYTNDGIEGNVLLNYDVDLTEIIIGRLAVTLVVIFSFPVLAHPCIGSVEELLFPGRTFSYKRRAVEVVFVVGSTFTIAFFVADVSLVLGIAGSTGSTLVGFILPGLFYTLLHPEQRKGRIVSALLVVLGVTFFAVSTWVTLEDALLAGDEEEASAANLCNSTLLNLENQTLAW